MISNNGKYIEAHTPIISYYMESAELAFCFYCDKITAYYANCILHNKNCSKANNKKLIVNMVKFTSINHLK